MARAIPRGLLVLLLLWRGAVSVSSLVREVERTGIADLGPALSLREEERIERGLGDEERKAGLPVGREVELYRALARHVGEDAVVHFVAATSGKSALAFSHMRVLLFPRRFVHDESIPADWRAHVRPEGHLYILEYEREEGEVTGEDLELLAEGTDFRLWYWRGGER